MDSDPISESTPKRRKLDYSSGKGIEYHYDDDSADELFDEMPSTVPTQPLTQYKRPVVKTQPKAPTGLFSRTMATIASGTPYETQPTQPLPNRAASRSSPDVEVIASSPARPSPAPARPTPLYSSMAPPGTAFRKPLGVPQNKPQAASQSATQNQASQRLNSQQVFDDPQIPESSDEEDCLQVTDIKPTKFVSGSNAPDFKKFAYKPAGGDMASAYGSSSRAKKAPIKQIGPARAQPVDSGPKSLDDITDIEEYGKVKEMLEIVGKDVSVAKCLKTLRRRGGNKWDALEALTVDDEDELARGKDAIVISDDEKPVIKSTKQDVRAKETIRARHQGQQHKSPVQVKPKRKLMQGRKNKTPEPEEEIVSKPKPVLEPKPKPQIAKKRKAVGSDTEGEVEIPSDSSGTDEEEPEEDPASQQALLDFLNTCSAVELADLANAEVEAAELLIASRPFRSFNDVRRVSDVAVSKARGVRKTIGEKLLDVCEDMWTGYKAVDTLVEQCKELGRPIMDTMKRWGVDLEAVAKTGELEMVNADEAHDSGIGTPASGFEDIDDVVAPRGKKSVMLTQPSNMSKDLIMKDYQVLGLNWLNLLWTKKLSCILADDMGLGKTCQIISFFAHLKQTDQAGPHLVVVPGSTLENWAREFANFCPDINVELYYGTQKEREEAREEIRHTRAEIDVVVTTYDTARNKDDNHFLRKEIRPRICVFDEGHMLKNAESSRYKELMKIKAESRILLTGTPLQNNLQELASLLGFMMPELFKEAEEDFKKVFKYKASTRDASHSALLSDQRIGRARSMMGPFILRRKKTQVLSSLPAKTRRVEYCDMTPAQNALWDMLAAQATADRAATTSAPRRRKANGTTDTVHMMAFRFAALHPLLLRRMFTDAILEKLQNRLIKHKRSCYFNNRKDLMWRELTTKIDGGDFGMHRLCGSVDCRYALPVKSYTLQNEEWMTLSGKIPVLTNLLQSWIPDGHRVLIFSQFTSLLNVLEAVLQTLDIKFCRLDGSTQMKDRQALIDAFTTDNSISVFLLSTKAGGAGINLAAADKIVIMEPGFNPQDEIQAENRAHRVGQTRPVEVVRLITRGTIEEDILKLGESKLMLDDRVSGEVKQRKGTDSVESGTPQPESVKAGEKAVEERFFQNLADKDGKDKKGEDALAKAQKEMDKLYPRLQKDDGKVIPDDDFSVAEESGSETREDGMDVDGDDGSDGAKMDIDHPQASPELTPEVEKQPTGRRRRKAAPVTIKDDESSEEEKPIKKAKKSSARAKQGGDIGAMFRKGLRGKGIDVRE